MKIIELTETQFKNYSKLHSSRNYFQTIEYANIMNNYNRLFYYLKEVFLNLKLDMFLEVFLLIMIMIIYSEILLLVLKII